MRKEDPIMDEIRRTILKTGAAAATVAAAPQVFAQQTGQATTKFYERGAVRIAYQEAGSGDRYAHRAPADSCAPAIVHRPGQR
jgi:hypothetical protein